MLGCNEVLARNQPHRRILDQMANVCVRIAQRILALVAAIWHNDQTGAPVRRSLTAYDH
jgi:hypothetical protein